MAFLFSTISWGAKPVLDIKLNANTKPEQKAKALLEQFSRDYDLKPYLFTSSIVIEERAVPHRHPILTLNTREIGEPKRYLTVLLHEEMHWFFDLPGHKKKIETFVAKIKMKYPKVPSRNDGGAEDDESTYLHLGVCYYELLASLKLLGDKEGARIFETEDVYPWVRKKVLEDRAFIEKSLKDSDLSWMSAN